MNAGKSACEETAVGETRKKKIKNYGRKYAYRTQVISTQEEGGVIYYQQWRVKE